MEEQVFTIHGEIEDSHWWFAGRRRIIHDLLRAVVGPGVPGRRLVEIGCGTGGVLGPLAGAFSCIGLDTSATAIAIAQGKYPGCRFIHGAFPAALPDPEAATAAFLLCDVLEHIDDDRAFMEGLVATAQLGCPIILTVPAGHDLWSGHDVVAGHVRRYEPEQLAATWAGLPVRVRLLSPCNSRLYWPIWLVRQVTRLLGATAGAGGTDFAMPPKPVNAALAALFGGEAQALVKALDRGGKPAFARGVSLVAVLERI